MKNFFAGVKTSLNTIFPKANFSDETTESEVLDFLGTQEGQTSAAVQALEAQASEGAEDIAQLTEAVANLIKAQSNQQTSITAVQEDMKKLQTTLNGISAKLVVPKDDNGGDAPATPKQDGNTFSTPSRSADVLKAAKILLNQG